VAGAGYKQFADGDVLTAAQVQTYLQDQSVMVFADSSARDTALGTAVGGGNALAEGMVSYLSDSNAIEVYDGTGWTGVSKMKRVEAFTANGTWTVPAGVTYAIAHMLGGGGGGGGQTGAGTDGGSSSVAFASGTVTALGGEATGTTGLSTTAAYSAPANSGRAGTNNRSTSIPGGDAQWIVAGASVTPAASISVVVGAGGTGGTGGGEAGGSGYVWIEYYE